MLNSGINLIQLTPFKLMYGRSYRLLFDLSEPLTSVVQPQQYLSKLHQYLVQAKQMVRDNIQHQQHQMKMRYDQNRVQYRNTISVIGFIFGIVE
ncbi:unnamed protein product [Didymodactylos carnosus]|uniref:Uncharacterized protein n=1 Tax=Didymodactylos carnosus TaxID=1234261 RepID=A0A816BT73_9BILA|nr:unnamed protein product [Didymodactylos carnosus]CAF1613164.1 unnamed protein product [Didymodactylos carnosus]CAF3909281.1 unnamed protein product [Didymodactylos carnosus]CAF4497751.1 unnamed protein product [Didymodactylos carnosus]